MPAPRRHDPAPVLLLHASLRHPTAESFTRRPLVPVRVPGVFDYLRFRTFAHATEDRERVREAVRNAMHATRAELQEEGLEGSHGNPILVLEGDVRGNPAIRALFVQILRDDPEGAARLVEEMPRRLDEQRNFYFRLDKQRAYQGRMTITAGDDAIHVRGRLVHFLPPGLSPEEALRGFLGEIAARGA